MNFNKIRQDAAKHKISPRPELWTRLDEKLSNKTQANKIFLYKRWLVAASFLGMVCLSAILYLTLMTNTQMKNVDLHSSTLHFENIDTEQNDSQLYNIALINQLNSAYAKILEGSKI